MRVHSVENDLARLHRSQVGRVGPLRAMSPSKGKGEEQQQGKPKKNNLHSCKLGQDSHFVCRYNTAGSNLKQIRRHCCRLLLLPSNRQSFFTTRAMREAKNIHHPKQIRITPAVRELHRCEPWPTWALRPLGHYTTGEMLGWSCRSRWACRRSSRAVLRLVGQHQPASVPASR